MINKVKYIGLFFLVGALILAGCTGGTGEGNPELGQLSITLKAKPGPVMAKVTGSDVMNSSFSDTTASDSILIFDKQATPFLIKNIFVHVEKIEIKLPEFSLCRASDTVICTDSSLMILGPFYVDLLESPSPEIVNNILIPKGLFYSMNILFSKLENGDTLNVPVSYASLIGHAIVIKGSFSYGGMPNRSITVYLDFDERFGFGNNMGLLVSPDSAYNWDGVFAAGSWFNNLGITYCLDSGQLTLEPGGSLIIDSESSCNNIDEMMIENVKGSTFLQEHEEDDDDDDEIDIN